MRKTLAQIHQQIQALQTEADELRKKEVAGVIAKIKTAIEHYGITAQDLFGGKRVPGSKGLARRSAAKLGREARYRDAAGNEWVGRGPRPKWLRDALGAGKKLEDFAVGERETGIDGVAPSAAPTKPAEMRRSKTKKRRVTPTAGKKTAQVSQYTDGTNTWRARGPRPAWLKEAIASGKTLEELRVQ